jgi:anti-sigma factor RsiW
MSGQHIDSLLDRIDDLDAHERQLLDSHVEYCRECRNAFRAAVASRKLIVSRAADNVEPSPFFASRVMAVIREKRSAVSPFAEWWRAGRVFVGSMVSLIVLLIALTIAIGRTPIPQSEPNDEDIYAADWAILGDASTAADMSDIQVINTLYEADADGQSN